MYRTVFHNFLASYLACRADSAARVKYLHWTSPESIQYSTVHVSYNRARRVITVPLSTGSIAVQAGLFRHRCRNNTALPHYRMMACGETDLVSPRHDNPPTAPCGTHPLSFPAFHFPARKVQ